MEKADHAATVDADMAELRARVDAFETTVSQHLTRHGQEMADHRALVSDMKQAIAALTNPAQPAARRKRKR